MDERGNIRVLSFFLGEENYCIKVEEARGVVVPGSITKVPNTPEFIIGVMNLRGEIITLIDIRHFFNLTETQRIEDMKIIVTDVEGSPVGILVDRIGKAFEIGRDAIQPPLATLKGSLAEYTKGQIQLDKRVLVFLNLDKILDNAEINRLKKGE